MVLVEEIPPERIQGVTLVVIAGFLGAGKTTVLNHLVKSNPGDRIGVLVNDFGEIDVDAELIANADGETITLTNGCICCTIKDDLVLTMFRLLHRDDPPDRILIECSGVSDPSEVIRAFADAQLHDIVRIDSIVAVVDAEQLTQVEFRDQPMALHQLVSADLVVVNKVDLVDSTTLAEVHNKVRSTVPRARTIECSHGQVPFEVIMGGERIKPQQDRSQAPPRIAGDHGSTFQTMAWSSERPLSLKRLREALDDLPVEMYRAKGIVHVDGLDEHRVVVHVVGNRVSLQQGEPWGDEERTSKLVAIGRPGTFVEEQIRAALAACEVDPGQGVGRRLMDWLRRR